MQAKLYKTDGSVQEVSPKDGKEFSLQEMYDLIGCTIVELAIGKDGDQLGDIWCDEEGLLKSNWIPNVKATEFYRAAHPDIDPKELVIVGDALFVPTVEKKNGALELENFIRDNFDKKVFGSDTTYKNGEALLLQFKYDDRDFEVVVQAS